MDDVTLTVPPALAARGLTPEHRAEAKKKCRQPGLTTNMIRQAADFTAMGLTRAYVAASLRVRLVTFKSWITRGIKDLEAGKESVYATLVRELDHADAKGCGQLLKIIQRQGAKDWRAAAWILERRHEAFANRTKTEVSGPDGEPLAPMCPVIILPASEDKPL